MQRNSEIVQIEIRVIDKDVIVIQEFLDVPDCLTGQQVMWLAIGYMQSKLDTFEGE